MPPNIIWVLLLFCTPLRCLVSIFSSGSLCWILPSMNSAVGSSFPISSLRTSWQRLVSCLWKLFLLPEHLARLHFPAFLVTDHVGILWTDLKYVLCPAFSWFPTPCPSPFIQRLNTDNHDNLKSQVLNIVGHKIGESWILVPILGVVVGGGFLLLKNCFLL